MAIAKRSPLKKETSKENIEVNDIKMILKEKEKLLSFETPLRFIFSVWGVARRAG